MGSLQFMSLFMVLKAETNKKTSLKMKCDKHYDRCLLVVWKNTQDTHCAYRISVVTQIVIRSQVGKQK